MAIRTKKDIFDECVSFIKDDKDSKVEYIHVVWYGEIYYYPRDKKMQRRMREAVRFNKIFPHNDYPRSATPPDRKDVMYVKDGMLWVRGVDD